MSALDAGRRYSIDTIIPPVAANTRYVDAGAIAIGIEYRIVNEEIVKANLDAHGLEHSSANADGPIPDDGGVSLHVCDAATHTEYLRFDAFDSSPHYHYLCDGEYQLNIPFDATACGNMTSWALRCIQERLPAMLAFCGAHELAAQVDQREIDAVMPTLSELVGRTMVGS
jgi:hypothetical protein